MESGEERILNIAIYTSYLQAICENDQSEELEIDMDKALSALIQVEDSTQQFYHAILSFLNLASRMKKV